MVATFALLVILLRPGTACQAVQQEPAAADALMVGWAAEGRMGLLPLVQPASCLARHRDLG